MPPTKEMIAIACQWPVVCRALIMAAIVGTILVSINHGMCICSGKFGLLCFVQSALTFFVPYAVSTISSVLALAPAKPKPPVKPEDLGEKK